MRKAYYNCVIVSEGSEKFGMAVLVENGYVVDIVPAESLAVELERINLDGAFLAPGLIDLQIYGSGGKLFGGKPTVEALMQMEEDLLKQGTTGFFATVATNSDAVVEQAIEAAKAFRTESKGVFLGLHLEGPYLNSKRKGAHPEEFIKKATLPELKKWVEAAAGELKMMTVAPELQDPEILAYLAEQGIIISCGHSDATYSEALGFLNRPVHAATHLFNAMPPVHHRNPGLAPAIFEKKPYASIIADGIHVHFGMLMVAKQLLQDKLFFITDAVTETREGLYQHVFTGDRYTMPDGTLSGSCMTMLQSVKNGVENADISLPEAINMASLYPAELIRANDLKGKIAVGYRADFVAFDKTFQVKRVTLNGEDQ